MRMSRRLSGGLLAAALTAGMATAALPAQAALAAPTVQARTAAVTAPTHPGMELQATLHGNGAWRHAAGRASYEAGYHRAATPAPAAQTTTRLHRHRATTATMS